MKKIIVVILLFVGLSSCMNFNPTFDKLSELEKNKYQPKEYDSSETKLFFQMLDTNISVYKLDLNILKELIKQSDKRYFLLVSYTYWCPSSKVVFDSIVNADYHNTQLILFTPDDWYYVPNYKRFLKKHQYYQPTFILDIYQYGFGYNPHKRFDKFKSEISKNLTEIGGFPSYLLIDSNLNVLLKRSGGGFNGLLLEINEIVKTKS